MMINEYEHVLVLLSTSSVTESLPVLQTLTRTEQFWQWWNSGVPKVDLPKKYGLQYSEKEFAFENLVLKGGGAKGIAYIGACQVLDEAGILPNIKRFAGTSAGAITATLLAIGMSPQEMLEELSKKNLMDLLDPPVKKGWFGFLDRFPHIPGVPSWLTVDMMSMAMAAVTGRGVCEGEEFLNWFGDILDRNLKRLHPGKIGLNKDITFEQLYHTLGTELCIVAYNMVFGNETYFHVKTTPMMKILDTVRMSMSIPVAFKPYERIPGFTFIDGGLAANYPIWAFDGWYLSLEEEDTFYKKLMSIEDGEKIVRMFHPEYRSDRFGARNDKTLGILMFSSNDRELYQEKFVKRLEKLADVKRELKKEHPDTELCKKYQKETEEREALRKAKITTLKNMVGDHVKKLIEDIEGEKLPALPKVGGGMRSGQRMKRSVEDEQAIPRPVRRIGISKDQAEREFKRIFSDEDIKFLGIPNLTKDEAFKSVMLDEDGKLTTDRLRKMWDNVGPLQLVRRTYLGLRVVSSPRRYYSTMLEFVGSNSGIDKEDIHRSVAIDVDYVGTMDFDMAPEDMEFLMRQGAAATIAFLEEKKGSI
ncbi:uncharacterized protein LOC144867709 [Branchiostoma floridae x Branchiostoma japonicum]